MLNNLKDWVYENQSDILEILEGYRRFKDSLEIAEAEIMNLDPLLTSLNNLANLSASTTASSSGRLKGLLKLHLSDLISPLTDDPVLSLLTSPAKQLQNQQDLLYSKLMTIPPKIKQLKRTDENDYTVLLSRLSSSMCVNDMTSCTSIIETIEMACSSKDSIFLCFSQLGAYRKLKKQLFLSLPWKNLSKADLIACSTRLHNCGLQQESQNVLLSGFGDILSKSRDLLLESIVDNTDIAALISFYMTTYKELTVLIKSKFATGSNASNFIASWLEMQTRLLLIKIWLKIDSNLEHFQGVWRIVRVELGKGDVDGIGVSYVIDSILQDFEANEFELQSEQVDSSEEIM